MSSLLPRPAHRDVAEFIDEDDEILLELSDQLGKLIEPVGGPNHAHVLLVPLEALCAVEESTVRDRVRTRTQRRVSERRLVGVQSVASITTITNALTVDNVAKYVFPALRRLATGDWYVPCVLSPSVLFWCSSGSRRGYRLLDSLL